MAQQEGYLDDISDAVKQYDTTIKAVKGLQILFTVNYNGSSLSDILGLAERGDIEGVKTKYQNEPATGRQLMAIQFKDQHAIAWTGLVYDSDELWQDPEVIQLYR